MSWLNYIVPGVDKAKDAVGDAYTYVKNKVNDVADTYKDAGKAYNDYAQVVNETVDEAVVYNAAANKYPPAFIERANKYGFEPTDDNYQKWVQAQKISGSTKRTSQLESLKGVMAGAAKEYAERLVVTESPKEVAQKVSEANKKSSEVAAANTGKANSARGEALEQQAKRVSEANKKSSDIAAANTGMANHLRAEARENGEYSYDKYLEWAAAKGNWETSEEDYQKWAQAQKVSASTKRSSEKAAANTGMANSLKAAAENQVKEDTSAVKESQTIEVDKNVLNELMKKLNYLLSLMTNFFGLFLPQTNESNSTYMSVNGLDYSEIQDIENDLQ